MILVRSLEPAQWAIWRQLRLRALKDSPEAFGSSLAATLEREAREGEAFWRGYFSETGPVLIAELDGVPAGMARLVVEDPADSAHLYSLWVAPEARGRGAGEQLLRTAADWLAARHPGTALRLDVVATNRPARRLYERLGFTVLGPNPEDDAELVMEQRLEPRPDR
ncbi:GNAT family N-acetyltransferase [Brachybacterium sp. J153]|uniref:GNAT family N-acetyltransferase n=1 Tax=Brachybacterium sp. J153 TaxID=3116488 RepID=UPI002E772D39|nr:GNAT family N-acetyltransferase [Brachybacterium sp. J153]MEE1619373.1 GNAT family N-acetyltransferase [Brachybacterium sp. J153]